ncbi:MAG: low specificity L-threonine aldolase [Chitinophagaceae bacterium]
MKSFASDNYAGVLPEVMAALQDANQGHARSYGADAITKRTTAMMQDIFGGFADVLFVYNGTGANVLSISACVQSHQSVLCTETSHIYNDESSAPETLTGCRFFAVPANADGKLECSELEKRMIRKGDVHYAQPGLVSITQATEYGTVYSPAEIEAISAFTRKHEIYLHMDGSRFFNAAASLGCSLSELSKDCCLDILSLGGTKLGMMFGEAVIVFNENLAKAIRFQQKQVMQLHSKTRFIAAQFEAVLKGELWLKTALHANQMATLLAAQIGNIPGVKITKPVQANAVFATIPPSWNEPMMAQFPYYVWKDDINEVRLMCGWDTQEAEVREFAKRMKLLSV